jgi:Uma2 family endonuclease
MVVPTIQPTTYGLDASIATFTVRQYQRMIETGILTSDDKVELLENYVVRKMPRNPPHDGTIHLISKRLARRIPAGWELRAQLTIVLSDSQPEPDFAVVRGDETTYLTAHPQATDVGLVIEVADSSLLRGQRDKTRIYARAGIPCYWIVNLVERRIEVYDQPSGPVTIPTYSQVQNYQSGDSLPLLLQGQVVATIPVDQLLP